MGIDSEKQKPTKQPCKINLTDDLFKLIKFKCEKEDKFIEQVFEDAIRQMIIPRMGEVGFGHPDFEFKAPLMIAPGIEKRMVWIKIKFWKRLKEITLNHRVSIHAIVYTALINHLKQYEKEYAAHTAKEEDKREKG